MRTARSRFLPSLLLDQCLSRPHPKSFLQVALTLEHGPDRKIVVTDLRRATPEDCQELFNNRIWVLGQMKLHFERQFKY